MIRPALTLTLLAAGVGAMWAQPPERPLPKACWPESRLVGKDTQYFYAPCNDLRTLDPAFRRGVECTLARMREHGKWETAVVFEARRSDARQRALYAQGRTRPGVRVTNASSARTSPHGTGFAVDVIHSRTRWDNPKFFQSLEDHAFTCGLEAGNGWRRFPDPPHLQATTWRKPTPPTTGAR